MVLTHASTNSALLSSSLTRGGIEGAISTARVERRPSEYLRFLSCHSLRSHSQGNRDCGYILTRPPERAETRSSPKRALFHRARSGSKGIPWL